MSFVVRIVPSPDWFVGVDSLDLCDGDRWREQVAVDLYPYDAGTDSGFTFSSPNFATIPQDTVTEVRGVGGEGPQRPRPCPQHAGLQAAALQGGGPRPPATPFLLLPTRGPPTACAAWGGSTLPGPGRGPPAPGSTPRPHPTQAHARGSESSTPLLSPQITSSSPSHPANSFYYPRLKSLPPIARVTLVRLRQNPRTFLLPAPSPAGAGGGNEIADSLSGERVPAATTTTTTTRAGSLPAAPAPGGP